MLLVSFKGHIIIFRIMLPNLTIHFFVSVTVSNCHPTFHAYEQDISLDYTVLVSPP